MPVSLDHEALVALFRNRPSLAPELMRDALGLVLPAYETVQIESADLTEIQPAEYRADLVVLLVDGKPVLAIVVEVQLGIDTRKSYTWPVYVAGVRARFECDACVLVVTATDSVAAWARKPIAIGPGSVLQTLVVGPQVIPVVADIEAALLAPELAVLSALAHGNEPGTGPRVALAAAAATRGLPDDRSGLYWDLVLASLGDATRSALEALMSSGHYEYQSEFAKQYFAKGKAEGEAKGKAEGKAEGVLRVLEARGVDVTQAQRARILACIDLATLDRWLERSVTAKSADDVLLE